MTATVSEIIGEMSSVAGPGQPRLGAGAQARLRSLTASLLAAKPEAALEYERFLSIGRRSLPLDTTAAAQWIRGRTVIVTGGTGCVGSVLMTQLSALRPARLVSVSRGRTSGWPRLPDAEYLTGDVRDLPRLIGIVRQARPDVVFHVAAQRSPALAEVEVHRTVTTNVLGTRNVIIAAERGGVSQVVCASTGKALRPYTPDVYAASKRAAEWALAAAAAARGGARYSAARFTHVVDNSIIHQRLLDWSVDGVVRLHGPAIVFYAQSALESAQLLLRAGLGAAPGRLMVHAITDLGWPVGLLDLALGVLQRTGSTSPVYFSGYDRGYEGESFPGLYDPATAGDLSPLLSAFEAGGVDNSGGVDAFPLAFARDPGADQLLESLVEICARTQDPDAVRAALDQLSWALLDATVRATPSAALVRAARLTAPHRDRLSPDQQRMLIAIERHAGRAQPPAGAAPSPAGAGNVLAG